MRSRDGPRSSRPAALASIDCSDRAVGRKHAAESPPCSRAESLFLKEISLLAQIKFPVTSGREFDHKWLNFRAQRRRRTAVGAGFCEIPCYQGIGGVRPVRGGLCRRPLWPARLT